MTTPTHKRKISVHVSPAPKQLKGTATAPIKLFEAHPYLYNGSQLITRSIEENDWNENERENAVQIIEVYFQYFDQFTNSIRTQKLFSLNHRVRNNKSGRKL